MKADKKIKTNNKILYAYNYNSQQQKQLSRLISTEIAKINHFTTKTT